MTASNDCDGEKDQRVAAIWSAGSQTDGDQRHKVLSRCTLVRDAARLLWKIKLPSVSAFAMQGQRALILLCAEMFTCKMHFAFLFLTEGPASDQNAGRDSTRVSQVNSCTRFFKIDTTQDENQIIMCLAEFWFCAISIRQFDNSALCMLETETRQQRGEADLKTESAWRGVAWH